MENPHVLSSDGIPADVLTYANEELMLPPLVLAAWIEYNCGENTEATIETANEAHDAYQGIYDSEKAFAKSLVYECGGEDPRKWFHAFINWDEVAEMLFKGDYAQILLPSGEIAVFRA